MRYCPNCEKPYPEDDYECPDCGYSPEGEQEAEVTAKMPVPVAPAGTAEATPHTEAGAGGKPAESVPEAGPGAEKGLKSRKNIILIALGAAVVIAAIVGGILLYLHGRSEPAATTTTSGNTTTDSGIREYQKSLTENWNTLRDITEELVKKDSEVADQASLNSFSALLTVSIDKIEQVRNEMGRIEVPDDYKLRHKNLIDAVGSYQDYLKSLVKVTSVDPAKVTAADFELVNTIGADAQKKVVASEKQLPFLRALPDECFILHTTLNTFYTAIWQQPQTPRPRPAATPTPAPAGSTVIPGDSGLTSATAGGFSESYLVGDFGSMESYLSGGGWNFEFNYSQTPYSWEYGDATGQADIVRITYLFAGTGGGPFLEDWAFQVAYVNDAVYIVNSSLILRTEFTDN